MHHPTDHPPNVDQLLRHYRRRYRAKAATIAEIYGESRDRQAMVARDALYEFGGLIRRRDPVIRRLRRELGRAA